VAINSFNSLKYIVIWDEMKLGEVPDAG